jgi:hypothetical protein
MTSPITKEELAILAAAAMHDDGEYSVVRDYNKPWGEEHAALKRVELLGFMKLKSAGRVAPSQQYARQSVITDAGRAALAAATP